MWGLPATVVLVETFLDRGTNTDMAEAEAAIVRLATAPADEGLAIPRHLTAAAAGATGAGRGDDTAYASFRDRYRDMAKTLGLEGHIAMAEAMVADDE